MTGDETPILNGAGNGEKAKPMFPLTIDDVVVAGGTISVDDVLRRPDLMAEYTDKSVAEIRAGRKQPSSSFKVE